MPSSDADRLLARMPAHTRFIIDHNPTRRPPYIVTIYDPNDARKVVVKDQGASLANALQDVLRRFEDWKLRQGRR